VRREHAVLNLCARTEAHAEGVITAPDTECGGRCVSAFQVDGRKSKPEHRWHFRGGSRYDGRLDRFRGCRGHNGGVCITLIDLRQGLVLTIIARRPKPARPDIADVSQHQTRVGKRQ
jgi:hypothetical protein